MNKEKLFGLEPGNLNKAYANLIKTFILLRYKIDSNSKIPLVSKSSEFVSGLEQIYRGEIPAKQFESDALVGTIRMGYGHHRMAYSVYSWILQKKLKPLLHDLLSIDSNEADAIKEIDGLYSQLSRASSEWGGLTEWAWGQITAQGNIGSLYLSTILAETYKNLLGDINKALPYISTYPLNGQIAVESGFNSVHQLICDNFPQYYLLVPGAINYVQSPSSYYKYIEMGVPKENLEIAGHWVSEPIATNAKLDSEARLRRINQKEAKRILLAIGGAGAQKNYTLDLLDLIKDKLKSGEIHLYINAGDHKGLSEILQEKLASLNINFTTIGSFKSMLDFCDDHSFHNKELKKPSAVTLFCFEKHFEAFLTTDYLIRISDIMATKPSELAFFPIPKLFIRRVGDHEAMSAFRSMELGEGTTECREVGHAVEMLKLLTEQDSILTRMNECVIKNFEDGIYFGSKKVVERALKI
jgi:hypothetical protein